MTVNEMLNNVIRKYGFEVKETLAFARLCERHPNGGWLVNYNYKRLMRGYFPLFLLDPRPGRRVSRG